MEVTDYLRFALAFVFVLSLMGGLALLLRRFGKGTLAMPGKRLQVIEVRPIDARHRLAIVKCDDTEHLLVLSPDGQTVVQNNLPKGPVQ